MAKAKKLPSGNWRVQIFDYTDTDGKRHYKSFTASSKKEAEYLASEYALNKKDKKSAKNISFGDALDNYITLREPVLSPRTIMDYKRIREHDLQELMPLNIYKMNQEQIQIAINNDAKIHSPKTVRNNHGLVSAVLKMYRPDFALNTVLPKKIRPNLYIPSDYDVRRLMEYVKDTEMELPILLAAFGPMRRGEICALDTDHITGNTVHVEKNMVCTIDNQWTIKQPKSYAGDRFIKYPDFVADKWIGINGKITTLTPDCITTRFARILRRAGIQHFRFHDLRHYCASIQHALGIPDAYIMERGGWSSDGVLKSVYRHAMSDKTKDMDQKANDHFTDLCNTEYNTQNKNP